MSMDRSFSTQWQLARQATAADVILTAYKPTDMVAAVKAKTFAVHPATLIALRFFGKTAADQVATATISGWMDWEKPAGPGPGHVLWQGAITLGALTYAEPPITHPQLTGTWLEADTIATGSYSVGVIALDGGLSAYPADKMSMLLLPTLGYHRLLLEFTTTFSVAEIIALWRPLSFEQIQLHTNGSVIAVE